jgi:hypothetical protein
VKLVAIIFGKLKFPNSNMLVEELKNLCQLCTTENELDSTRESEDIDKITSLFNFVS